MQITAQHLSSLNHVKLLVSILEAHSEVTRCAPFTTEQLTPVQVAVHGLLPCQLASAGGFPKAACNFCRAEPAAIAHHKALNPSLPKRALIT